jgi:hypothetical protein
MLSTLAVLWRVVISPVWALWRGYLGLWWAFDDASIFGLRAAPQTAGAPVSTLPGSNLPGSTLPDSTMPGSTISAQASKPVRLLKTGFALSLVSSFGLAWIAGLSASQAWMSEPGAWMFWAWGSMGAAVTSILAVRHAHRKDLARKAASLPHRAARAVRQGLAAAPQAMSKAGQACAARARSAYQTAQPRAASIAQGACAKASAWWRSAGAKTPPAGGADEVRPNT